MQILRTVLATRSAIALLLATPWLTACYVIPVQPDGRPYPVPGVPTAQGTGVIVTSAPVVLTARLYPANDIAARSGIIAGSVTSPSNGKGIFSIAYEGDTLSGEATRTAIGNSHPGIANASGPRGAYVRCSYRMINASQGTGECLFSDGAKFQLHLGS